MRRYDAIEEIVKVLENELVICNLGIPSKELYHLRDRNKNFYMMGSMGLASSISLGLAISKPDKKVWCIDGDGSILMNLGSLSTIANVNPDNLTLIIIDNGTYGSTGDQKTYTSLKTKLDIIAKGTGFESIKVVYDQNRISSVLKNLNKACHFILIKAIPGNKKVENIPLTPIEIKKRFMQSIINS
ncbi:MAG: sulfopyruvate decarboxylase subunit beta [Candidatus Hodarchaeota archaeon]